MVGTDFYGLIHKSLGDADVMNASWSAPGNIEDYSKDYLKKNHLRLIAVLSQSDILIESIQESMQGKAKNKPIMVMIAGNEGNTSPNFSSALHVHFPELFKHSLSVVSVDQNGVISDFSNRCGIAWKQCIAAPGEDVLVARSGGTYLKGQGTSFAGPMVSGGLAIMKHVFRNQLTNEELVSRLLNTANDDGAYATTSIYGQGLMDLGAATSPWGITGFMGTGSSAANSVANSLSDTWLSAGHALGDSFSTALDSHEIATFDSLGAPFWLNAGQFNIDGGGTTLATSLNAFMKPIAQPLTETWQFSLNNPSLRSGHMTSIPHGKQYFHVSGPDGVSASFYGQGLEVSWNPSMIPFSFSSGYIKENDSLLGSLGHGMFNRLGADTLFLSTTWTGDMGQWSLGATGEWGYVIPSLAGEGFIDNISGLHTTAFRLTASRELNNGSTLRFALSQPLRVQQGSMDFTLPSGLSDGVVTGSSHSAHLAPTGRQLDLTTALDLPLGKGKLSLGFTLTNQPRHRQAAGMESAVFTAYRTSW